MNVSATTNFDGHRTPLLADDGGAAMVLLRSSTLAVLVVSQHGEVVDANPAMATLLGARSPEQLVGRTLSGDLLPDASDWQPWRQAYAAGARERVTMRLQSADGSPRVVVGDLIRVSEGVSRDQWLIGAFIEAARERQLETAIQRAARMEALGSLSSGIAHDVNNLLTVLVGNLYLVGEELRENPPLYAKIKPARDAAKRGAALMRQLLNFSKREQTAAEAVKPAWLVENLAPLLRQAMGRQIQLVLKVSDDAGPVLASDAQLESVLVNLVINARDAIDGNGTISVSVTNRDLSESDARPFGLVPGPYTLIAVADDGCGIPDAVRERIFEPFFTTKQARGGSGLGLSMVRGFAESARGTVHINSRPGKGTVVTVMLPRLTESGGDTSAKTMPLSTLPTGSERIVLLARDEAVRATLRDTLQVLGYRVGVSHDPEDLFGQLHRDGADLLIIDAGAERGSALATVIRRVRALRPDAKVIVASDDADMLLQPARPQGPVLLPKPFSLAEVAGTVRRTLDGVAHV